MPGGNAPPDPPSVGDVTGPFLFQEEFFLQNEREHIFGGLMTSRALCDVLDLRKKFFGECAGNKRENNFGGRPLHLRRNSIFISDLVPLVSKIQRTEKGQERKDRRERIGRDNKGCRASEGKPQKNNIICARCTHPSKMNPPTIKVQITPTKHIHI